MERYYQKQAQFPLFPDLLSGDSSQPGTYDPEASVSDCESSVTGSSPSSSSSSSGRRRVIGGEKLQEGERIYELIRRRLVCGLGETTKVVSIRRRNWSDLSAQARVQSFQIHSKALVDKHGGPPNVKFGWYGGSRKTIQRIFSHGFSFQEIKDNQNGAVLLSPDHFPIQSAEESQADENGVRHLLLCRVLLGRSELVGPWSGQTHPSSDEFDSGLDDFHKPNKYIIWSTNMNTHILPEYVVSFTSPVCSPSIRGCSRVQNGTKMPTSPWISFPTLISVLGRFIPSDAVSLINKYHIQYKERRISRPELIQRVRQIAGDKLLIAVIKSCKVAKDIRRQFGSWRNRNTNK